MPRKALVVDDDADIRDMLAEQLTTHGFEVLTAGNGLEALLHVKRERPAVVVLDVMMPRLGGLETLKRIRAFHPEAKVVVVSGRLDGEVRRQALALGAAGVLEKPVSLPDLLRALGAYGAFDYVVKPVDLQYLSRSIETALLMARPEL